MAVVAQEYDICGLQEIHDGCGQVFAWEGALKIPKLNAQVQPLKKQCKSNVGPRSVILIQFNLVFIRFF